MILRNRRIFIVEDDPSNRKMYQTILEKQGAYLVFERWARDSTLPRLKVALPLDLIVLDLMFPNATSGYDVFDLIRAEPEFADIPIIAISGSDPKTEVPRAQEKGFAGFIAKPINGARLPHQIRAILRGEAIWETELG